MGHDRGELPASKAAGPEDDEPDSGLVYQVSAFPSNISPWPHMLSRASCIIPAEIAGYAISSDLIEFIDIEDVPGAFVEPLDRVRLDALPPDGAWLRPTRSLRDFVSSFTARRDR